MQSLLMTMPPAYQPMRPCMPAPPFTSSRYVSAKVLTMRVQSVPGYVRVSRRPDETGSRQFQSFDSGFGNQGSNCSAVRTGVFTEVGARQMYSAALAFPSASRD